MGLLPLLDRLLDRRNLLLHHGKDLVCFFARGGQHGQGVEGCGKALHAFGRGGAIADGLARNAIEVAAQGDDLAIRQRQSVGQVQFDLARGNRRGIFDEAQQGVIADGGVFTPFKTQGGRFFFGCCEFKT